MTKKTAVYDESVITMLKGEERVRRRPAVIFGSDGIEGCEHSIFEIISNAVDEAREGYGDVINVRYDKDRTVTVEDFGRGVPLGYNEKEGRYNWELVYCELYAGGKYNSNDEGVYEYSLGLNGLGAAATQYASEFMTVKSYRGDEVSVINFKKGKPDGELEKTPLSRREKRTGTVVTWRPDLEVFTDTAVPFEYFDVLLDKQAIVNAGLHFNLKYVSENGDVTEKSYYYEHGVEDYITRLAGDKAMTAPHRIQLETRGRDRADKPEYNLKAEAVFCFSNTVNLIEYYHNSSFLEHGGSPDKATRSAFVYAIDKYLKSKNKYNKNEARISFGDIEDCLILVINSFSSASQTSYENQTKKAITNEFITEALTDFLKTQLEVYFIEKPDEAEKIASQVLINKRSRESAESTRLNLKKKLQTSGGITDRVEKFVTCRSKDPEKREVYIVEGDSAMGSCIQGRDAEFQAIIPVRGKTLNCLKNGYDRIFKSDIIVDLLKVIGCGAEIPTKTKGAQNTFDISQLKWSKIIICTDADEDGFQIRTLLLTLFYRLLPTLIREGKVFIAESPLFEITTKDDTFFAYDEVEKADILKKLEGKKYTLQRSKGLGENEPEMMWKTTMNPATRRLIQISPTDAEKTAYIFETLLGDDLEERKDFITKYGKLYLAEADI